MPALHRRRGTGEPIADSAPSTERGKDAAADQAALIVAEAGGDELDLQ